MNNSNTELTLANIEALAQNEGGGNMIPCVEDPKSVCTYRVTLFDGKEGEISVRGLVKCPICP